MSPSGERTSCVFGSRVTVLNNESSLVRMSEGACSILVWIMSIWRERVDNLSFILTVSEVDGGRVQEGA